jgi:hypothetical protein
MSILNLFYKNIFLNIFLIIEEWKKYYQIKIYILIKVKHSFYLSSKIFIK